MAGNTEPLAKDTATSVRGYGNAGMSGANAQLQVGMVPQAWLVQAVDTSLQNTWNQGQAYPFQTTDFLGNIIEGTGTASGGTSSSTTPGPSALGQDGGPCDRWPWRSSPIRRDRRPQAAGSAIASTSPMLTMKTGGRILIDRENEGGWQDVRWSRDP